MTDPIKIFGTKPRSTHEYVGWLKTKEGNQIISNYASLKKLRVLSTAFEGVSDKAHTFNDQPLQKSWYVRGEEPQSTDELFQYPVGGVPKTDFDEYHEAYEAWKNWKPMFKGDWDLWKIKAADGLCHRIVKDIQGNGYALGFLEDFKTMNDFLNHCESQGIELEFNNPQ